MFGYFSSQNVIKRGTPYLRTNKFQIRLTTKVKMFLKAQFVTKRRQFIWNLAFTALNSQTWILRVRILIRAGVNFTCILCSEQLFLAYFISLRNTKQSLSAKKLHTTFLYEKSAHKMLVKMAPHLGTKSLQNKHMGKLLENSCLVWNELVPSLNKNMPFVQLVLLLVLVTHRSIVIKP